MSKRWTIPLSFILLLATMVALMPDVASAQSRWPPWQSYTEAEEAARKKTRRPKPSEIAKLNMQIAKLKTEGKYAEALVLAQRALTLAEKKGPDSPDVANALDTLAGVYEAQNNFAEAEPLLKRSLDIREKTKGQPGVAASRERLAATYDKLGRADDAKSVRSAGTEEYVRAGYEDKAPAAAGKAAEPAADGPGAVGGRVASEADDAKRQAEEAEAAERKSLADAEAEAERKTEIEAESTRRSEAAAQAKQAARAQVQEPAGGAAPPAAAPVDQDRCAREPALCGEKPDTPQAAAPSAAPPVDEPTVVAEPTPGASAPEAESQESVARTSDQAPSDMFPGAGEGAPPAGGAAPPASDGLAAATPPSPPAQADAKVAPPPVGGAFGGAPPPSTLPEPETRKLMARRQGSVRSAAPSAAPPAPPADVAESMAAAPPPPAMVTVSPSGAALAPPVPQPDFQVVPVYWGTDRAVQPNAKRLVFGSDRARRLQLGEAMITVPKAHVVPLVERPWVLKIPYFDVTIYAEKEDPAQHFTVQEIKALTREELLAKVRARLGMSKNYKDQALVFVHGYNTSFDNALYRTAQISYDLGFDGAPFLYSWPSGGAVASYTYDRESAQASEPYMREFLEMVVKETGAKQISIIAHSMGNQPLMDTLRGMKSSLPPGVTISQVILAAPDVDADNFTNLAKAIKGMATNVTLYAAANDRALIVSRNFWGSYRAGDVPPAGPLILPGIDTIDVTAASTDVFALNHSGYASNARLLQDIRELLTTGLRPPEARSLKPSKVTVPTGDYWRYVAAP